jgi:hypothetical protein
VEDLFIETTATGDEQATASIKVYPTVFDNKLTVEGLSEQAGSYSFTLVNTSRLTVWSREIVASGNPIEILEFPKPIGNDIYFLRVTHSTGKSNVVKVVKI